MHDDKEFLKYLVVSLKNKWKTIVCVLAMMLILTILIYYSMIYIGVNTPIFYNIFSIVMSFASIILTLILFDKLIISKKALLKVSESTKNIIDLETALNAVNKKLISQSKSNINDFSVHIKVLYKTKSYINDNEYYFLSSEPYKGHLDEIIRYLENNNYIQGNTFQAPDQASYHIAVRCDKIIEFINIKKGEKNE